jgi:hypothetical protein
VSKLKINIDMHSKNYPFLDENDPRIEEIEKEKESIRVEILKVITDDYYTKHELEFVLELLNKFKER